MIASADSREVPVITNDWSTRAGRGTVPESRSSVSAAVASGSCLPASRIVTRTGPDASGSAYTFVRNSYSPSAAHSKGLLIGPSSIGSVPAVVIRR